MIQRLSLFIALALSPLALALTTIKAEAKVIDLSGKWRFALDADNVGVDQEWFQKRLEDTVRLPGTTDENKKGIFNEDAHIDRLARVWYWKGPAWYQRDIDVPADWEGKRVTLFLERTKNCRVWVNGSFCGWDNTLSTPHIHDLTSTLRPGERNTITLLVDNAKLPPGGPSHQVDERTQTNWNGVVGAMELRATDPVWIEDVQVTPHAAKKQARVRLLIGNTTGEPAQGELHVRCRSYNVETPADFEPMTVKIKAAENQSEVEFTYEPGEEVPLWEEFNPAMLELNLKLRTTAGAKAFADQQTVRFGMRDFTTDRNQLLVNGTPIFLRGRLDCANYPLTGYAPMSKAEWTRIYSILKEWGLNHVRFHSWCPPKAAFEAADEMGFYLQAELPNKRSAFNAPENEDAAERNIDRLDIESTDTETTLYDYGKREGELISRNYGNHPSFVMFTLGNELGRNKGMFELVAHFKELDSRRLYAQGSNNMHWNPSLAEGDDFWVIGKVEDQARPVRGSFYIHDYAYGPVDTHPPGTLDDFSASIRGVDVPLIGHETGQYQVSPDYRDIEQFTGVLKARNYEIFRERIEAAGMLGQAHDFVLASGALSAICYREDIELALRTPGLGGIQLLDIMDFPGQSTALVGMLNVFMESKGVIDAEEWRRFCSPVVPLLRTKKLAWTSDETLMGKIQIAHYGAEDLKGAVIQLVLSDQAGKELASRSFEPDELARGQLHDIDFFAIALDGIEAAQRLDLTVSIKGTDIRNAYPIWVYPEAIDTRAPKRMLVARSLAEAEPHLARGGRVLLLPRLDQLPKSVKGGFQTEFWSPMFAKGARKRGQEEPPGTLGHICDPQHPALAAFPTEFHSNWQWWHLVKHSRPIILDETPQDYRPIVQTIDNFDRNHKLGLLFETKVGKGSLLVCAIDLPAIQNQPEGRQMLYSLQRYVASDAFEPSTELSQELLNQLLPNTTLTKNQK